MRKCAFLFFLLTALFADVVDIEQHYHDPFRLTEGDILSVRLISSAEDVLDAHLNIEVWQSGAPAIRMDSRNFEIYPGFNDIQAEGLSPWLSPAISRYFRLTGSLPSGEYRICVNVLSGDSPLGKSCATHRVQSPSDIDLITEGELFPGQPLVWSPVIPNFEDLEYRVKIWQADDKHPPEEIALSRPPFMIEEGLLATSLIPDVEDGEYICLVEAYIGDLVVS